jgi:hypothetical protein
LDRVPGGVGLLHSSRECLGLKDAHRSTHPHLPKDNEEVNAHLKHPQGMLDAATMVDPVLDLDDSARGLDKQYYSTGGMRSKMRPG